MRLAVIGGSGRTGKVFIAAALAAGHTVVAGIHRKNPFDVQNGLKVRPCDATNVDDVRQLLEGCDAVVSLIGHGLKSPKDVQTVGIKNIIQAMETTSCSRLVSLTGSGAREPGDTPNFLDKLLNTSISMIDPARIKDGVEHVRVLHESSVKWTILRVLKLTNGASKPFSLSLTGPAKLFAPRKDVAKAILLTIEDETYVHRSAILAPKNR
jgi:putative NADH-flavin reductase